MKVFPTAAEEMLFSLILTGWLLEVSVSKIIAHGNLTAGYGEEAHYRCVETNPAGVMQIKWQKLFTNLHIDILATYSKKFGQKVNDHYNGKVILTEASLSSTSITLKNLSWDDSSCYICSFNAYPDGTQSMQTCLTVQGISEVTTAVHVPLGEHEEGETREVLFNCSATGKPTPTIQWVYSADVSPLSQSQTTTVTNDDHTFTSSRSITLQVPPGRSGHVDCLLNSGMMGETIKRIAFPVGPGNTIQTDDDGGRRPLSLLVLFLLCPVAAICFAVVMIYKRSKTKEERKRSYIIA